VLFLAGLIAGYTISKYMQARQIKKGLEQFKESMNNQQEEVKQDKINVPLRKGKPHLKYPETSPDADNSFAKSTEGGDTAKDVQLNKEGSLFSALANNQPDLVIQPKEVKDE